MIKSNDTLKIPGQIRDRKRQKNNENSGIRVRIFIVLDYSALHCTKLHYTALHTGWPMY